MTTKLAPKRYALSEIYVLRVIAMHDFDAVVFERAYPSRRQAEAYEAEALADARLGKGPEWHASFCSDVSLMEFDCN